MRQLDGLVRRQYGVVHRRQAAALGLTARMIDHRLTTGEWLLLAPNVYALAGYPSSWRRQYKAAELSVPNGAIGGYAAGVVHDWDGFKTARRRSSSTTAAGTEARSRPSVEAPTSRPPPSTDFASRRRRRRCVTSCHACVSTAGRRPPTGCLLARKLSIDDLVERRTAWETSRRPGIGLLRSLVDERTADGWVPPESALERLLHQAVSLVRDCPEVEWQAPAPWAPASERVDGLIRPWMVILEADGRRWHARVADFDHDAWRDNQAAALGYRVLRLTWNHLNYRLDDVVEMIRQAGCTTAAA